MSELSLKRFGELKNIFSVFSLRDIQSLAVILTWAKEKEVSYSELQDYVKILPNILLLEQNGYFLNYQTIEQLRFLREIEKKLPRVFRRELRKARLNNTFSGRLNSSKEGG